MEVHQMLGRAGRPRHDPLGDACSQSPGNSEHADEIAELYQQQTRGWSQNLQRIQPYEFMLAASSLEVKETEIHLVDFSNKLSRYGVENDWLRQQLMNYCLLALCHRFIERTGEDQPLRRD